MTLADLYKKYEGQLIDWDDVAGAQCVDWCKMYLQECFGIRTKGKGTSPWGDAKEWWISTPKVILQQFAKIPYQSDFQFIRGDIVVWSGTHGHVAIATGEQDDNTFYTYDQNYGKNKTIRRVCHNRSQTILGVIRPYRKVLWDVNVRTKPSISAPIAREILKNKKVLPLALVSTGGSVAHWWNIGKGNYIAYKSLEVI